MQSITQSIQHYKTTTNPVTHIVCERMIGRENFNDYFEVKSEC